MWASTTSPLATPQAEEAAMAKLDVGQVLTGEVRRLASFGAFVDLG